MFNFVIRIILIIAGAVVVSLFFPAAKFNAVSYFWGLYCAAVIFIDWGGIFCKKKYQNKNKKIEKLRKNYQNTGI